MQLKTSHTINKNTEEAFLEVRKQISSNSKLIVFFSSTIYCFQTLTKRFQECFPHAQIVGITTTGEINKNGFSKDSLSVMSFEGEDVRAKSLLMEDIHKYPIFYRDDIIKSLSEVGIDRNSQQIQNQGVGLVFPNGLIMAEEKMLSVVNSVFKYDGFPIFGGTAGDDLKFQQTFVSCNGAISSTGGVVVFLKTKEDVLIHKENIFKTTGKVMKVTKADSDQRIVNEFNGKKASSEYARLLNVPEGKLANYFMSNPIGRIINDEIWIASPFQIFGDGSIQFYCQIFQDSIVEILEPKSPLDTLKESMDHVRTVFQQINGVLVANCILRRLQFESENLSPAINKEMSKLPNLCGFSSYGEQLGKNQLNQTMVLLAFGKKK